MKKTAVIIYPQFSEYEMSVALSILMQGKKEVIIVGLHDQPIRGESGLACIADTLLCEVDLNEIDSVLLPGCMDIGTLLEQQDLFDFIEHMASKKAIIASISSSPFLLAKAGALKGKKFTVGLTTEAMDQLGVFEKENYLGKSVVQDENIITAIGSGFVQFGITFGKALNLDFDENWYDSR